MKSYHLTFLSKNKNSLNRNFLLFTNSSALNCSVVKKYFQKKTKKHFLTILKSPHVNKSAQEQFEFHIFSKQLSIFSFKKSQDIYTFKKIRNTLFSDVTLKIKSSVNKIKKHKIRLKIFNPDNFKLNINKNLMTQKKELTYLKTIKKLKNFDQKNNKKIKILLQTFDIYGELCKIVWIAQSVEQRTENPCDGSSNLPLNNFLFMKNYLYNMFANIKKGQLAKRNFILNERKKICESFLQILWDEGFILGYKIEPDNFNKLKIFLKYKNGKPAISSLKLVSKPSLRVYYSIKQIWKIDSSKSFIIFSTNKGLKSIIECKKLKIGGEPFIIIN